jgi:hypothetical protein
MRVIETQILDALVNKKSLSIGKPLNSWTKWNRDTVQYNDVTKAMDYFLHGTLLASVHDSELFLGVIDGAWRTITTKHRINAIAKYYSVSGIYQENHIWYWTDGMLYTDRRIFTLDGNLSIEYKER